MEEHEPFISAIEAHPDDHTTRLVYADWLDDRDLPAGAYLRTELQLSQLSEGSDLAPELQARLRALRPHIEPAWLGRFDQPRVMLANPTPFPSGWWGIGLSGVRECNSTYQCFNYDILPTLRYSSFSGSFDWLPTTDQPPAVWEDGPAFTAHLNRLVHYLASIGLTVPLDLVRWVGEPELCRVPSCTDCYVICPWDAAAVANPLGARVVPFYIDSQGRLMWYLYLTPDGYSAVVASGASLCQTWPAAWESAPIDNPEPPEEDPDFVFVAPSVEAFLYRWCLENTLWHKLVNPQADYFDPTPITPEEQAYIDFYRERPAVTT